MTVFIKYLVVFWRNTVETNNLSSRLVLSYFSASVMRLMRLASLYKSMYMPLNQDDKCNDLLCNETYRISASRDSWVCGIKQNTELFLAPLFSSFAFHVNIIILIEVSFFHSHGSLETDFAINKLFVSDLPASKRSKFYPRHCMSRHRLGKASLQWTTSVNSSRG